MLRLNMHGEPFSLDPRMGIARRSQVVLGMLFEGLTRISQDGGIVPALAERISISQDKRTYTFYLRDARWSNGAPIRAHDFEMTWKSVIDPAFGAPMACPYYIIRGGEAVMRGELPVDELGVRSVDDRTLVVELEHPAPYFLSLLANPMFAPVCQEIVTQHPEWAADAGPHYACNGPFHLTRWKHGFEIELTKNPHYWDSDVVRLDGIRLTMVEDAQTVLELFEKGELDWAGEPLSELPVSAVHQLRANGQLDSHEAGGIFQLQFNIDKPPLGSLKLRQALAHAVDRQALVDHVLKGGESVATSILPPSLTLGEGAIGDGDISAARALFSEALAELGCSADELPPIVLSYATLEGNKAIAQAIQQQWSEALGIPIVLEGSDWNTYWANLVGGRLQIGAAAWFSRYDDPIYNLEHVKAKESGFNRTGWENSKYRMLLDASDREPDEAKRKELLREAEAIVMEELPLVPLYVATYKYLASDRVQGVFISDLGHVDFKWATLDQA